MDDERVTVTQVLVTVAVGAMIGVALTLLLYVASPTVRTQFVWLGPCIVGVCILVCLWLRYAPWWLYWPFDW